MIFIEIEATWKSNLGDHLSVLNETIKYQNFIGLEKILTKNLLTKVEFTWLNQSMENIIHYERPCM